MEVFGAHRRRAALDVVRGRVASAWAGARDHASITELLIEAGILESAVIDELQPRADETAPARDALRALVCRAGDLFVASWQARDLGPARERLAAALQAECGPGLPAAVTETKPEGYAWYALHPEAYVDAARRARALIAPDAVTCVGLRSIGTSLAAAVHAALAADGVPVASVVVRPRGHPSDREVTFGPGLDRWIRGRLGTHWWIVDEGPGLSGSSLVSVALALVDRGVPIEQITLLPAWDPDPARFSSARARAWWPRLRRVVSEDPVTSGRLLGGAARAAVDLGAGRWRRLLGARCPPRAARLYERRKLLLGSREPTVARFAGLGRWGRRARQRAERLHDAGYGPAVRGLVDGYLLLAFVPGAPVFGPTPADLVPRACAYVAERSRWAVSRPAPFDSLLSWIRTNTREGLGHELARETDALERFRSIVGDAGTVAVDGRLDRHEWVRTADGWLKADGVDHCADHFAPGCQDAAWDVAGLLVELGVSREAALRGFGAERRDLERRLPFYEVAYCAWRLGYAELARSQAAPEDARAWQRASTGYARALRGAIRRAREPS